MSSLQLGLAYVYSPILLKNGIFDTFINFEDLHVTMRKEKEKGVAHPTIDLCNHAPQLVFFKFPRQASRQGRAGRERLCDCVESSHIIRYWSDINIPGQHLPAVPVER